MPISSTWAASLTGRTTEPFILHPAGNPLYVANEDDNMVTVVDLKKLKVIKSVTVGSFPWGVVIGP